MQDKIRLFVSCNHFRCEIVRGTGIAQFFDFNFAATLMSSVLFEKWLEQDNAKHLRRHRFSVTLSRSNGSAL